MTKKGRKKINKTNEQSTDQLFFDEDYSFYCLIFFLNYCQEKTTKKNKVVFFFYNLKNNIFKVIKNSFHRVHTHAHKTMYIITQGIKKNERKRNNGTEIIFDNKIRKEKKEKTMKVFPKKNSIFLGKINQSNYQNQCK